MMFSITSYLLLITTVVYGFTPLTQTPPMRVALLVEPTPFNYISGYANRYKEMLKFLHQAGDQVEIVTADSDKRAPDNFMGFPIRTNRGFEFPFYRGVILSFDFAGSFKSLALRFKPDIIHVATPGCLMYPAIRYAKKYKIPLVFSYHTDIIEYTKAYFKFPGSVTIARNVIYHSLRHADLLLTTSPQLKKELNSIGLMNVDVWQKGINAERFSPTFRSDSMRNRLSDNNPNVPLMVYIGRLGVEKKITSLCTVMDNNPGVRLALVGEGPARASLEKYFAGYPVVFTGPLTGDSLSAAFASADLFAMPSDSETLGFVVLEAMASGVPVVGVAAGGVLDLVESGYTGYLVSNADNMAEFSARVRELVADVGLRRAMGVNARKWAEGWSWEAATSKLRNIQYKKAVENFHLRRQIEADDEGEKLLSAVGDLYRPDLSI